MGLALLELVDGLLEGVFQVFELLGLGAGLGEQGEEVGLE